MTTSLSLSPSIPYIAPSAKINISYSILFNLTTSYSYYFGGKKGISRNKTSFFLLMPFPHTPIILAPTVEQLICYFHDLILCQPSSFTQPALKLKTLICHHLYSSHNFHNFLPSA